MSEEFSALDHDQVSRICSYFGGGLRLDVDRYVGASPAELMEAIRRDQSHA